MTFKTLCLGVSLAAVALAGAANANQLEDIKARGELRCGTFADVPPFAAPDPASRELVGFDVDLCRGIAEKLGVTASITPLSVEARVPEVRLGNVDVTVANLAYTLSRAEQIQYSDPYYMAREMVAVRADDPATTKAELSGQRLASTKGSTSELSIRQNGSDPLTFQDTGSAFMAVQQNRARGIVANTMTITKLVNESQTRGVPMRMIEDPMIFQPIGVGMKKDEPELLEAVNAALHALDEEGKINEYWNRWLGPDTEYKMTRNDRVVALDELEFEPIP